MADQLPNLGDLFDDGEELYRLQKTMYPHLVAGYRQGVTNTDGDPGRLFTAGTRQRYYGKSLKYAALVVQTTHGKLQEAIDETFRKGDGVRGLAARINDVYRGNMGYRSLRIARTQLTESINDGVYQTLDTEGHDGKEWSTVIDGQERPSHHKANGQVVGIREFFTLDNGSCQFPGDDNLPPGEKVNCRCTIVAADTPARTRRAVGRVFLRTHGALERRYVVSLRRAFRAERDRVLSRLPQ